MRQYVAVQLNPVDLVTTFDISFRDPSPEIFGKIRQLRCGVFVH